MLVLAVPFVIGMAIDELSGKRLYIALALLAIPAVIALPFWAFWALALAASIFVNYAVIKLAIWVFRRIVAIWLWFSADCVIARS